MLTAAALSSALNPLDDPAIVSAAHLFSARQPPHVEPTGQRAPNLVGACRGVQQCLVAATLAVLRSVHWPRGQPRRGS
jgi:hypothetical protein